MTFRSTYRLQLEKDFNFFDALKIYDYLSELGISHLYLSPIFEARPGSRHGYDAVDPRKISVERGGEKAFEKLLQKIKPKSSLHGVILDIVPNHVAVHSENPMWWDALKYGPDSKYWKFFDIRAHKNSNAKVLLPVLGRSRHAVIAGKELKIETKGDDYVFKYYENLFPIHPRTYAMISEKMSTSKIERLLWEQHYILEEWRKGSRLINYRRFFDVNELAGLRVEDQEVFDETHQKLKQLTEKFPQIHGVRVDHIDGLTEPHVYLQRLNKISSNIWVEKILGEKENLPSEWSVNGSTGYEFSNAVARIFVDVTGLLHLHAHYVRHIDSRWERFHDCVYESKREMLESHFPAELSWLSEALFKALNKDTNPQYSAEDLLEALTEVTCSLRVYRTYAKQKKNPENHWLKDALIEAEARGRIKSYPAFEALKNAFLQDEFSSEVYGLVKRWEQLSGPVMAKGLEDTALYRYFPLLSLNGVGGEPDWVGDGAKEFHAFNKEGLQNYPLRMNASSTHDTKRSEDVRCRIHVLSEISEDWVKYFDKTYKKNLRQKKKSRFTSIDIHTEYLIYETLLGAWPFSGKIDADFVSRMQAYFLKASREAKSETSWVETNPDFEERLKKHVDDLLQKKTPQSRKFIKDFSKITARTSYFGAFNSLSMLTLKVFSPGIPDFYQGNEMWDLSLVDPDNRRTVDYELRQRLLEQQKKAFRENPKKLFQKLRRNWTSGEIKLFLTHKWLEIRQADPELFLKGEYYALELQGEGQNHFFAFMRCHDGRAALVVVPRCLAKVLASQYKKDAELVIKKASLLNTQILLPTHVPQEWRHSFTGREISGPSISAADVLEGLPVGVLLTAQKQI